MRWALHCWALHYSQGTVDALYHKVERPYVKLVTAVIRALAEDPTPDNMQVDEDDPSVYWVPAPGDYIILYEIIDERQIVRILAIE